MASPNESHNPSNEKLSFENSLERLQKTVQQLESGQLSLEDALKAFESGVTLVRNCQEYLSSAEKRIEFITQNKIDSDAQSKT